MSADIADGGSLLEARYVNHFEIGHNEYEFLFDFGQYQPGRLTEVEEPAEVRIVRVVMGPPFAKALLDTLVRAVAEYEQQHGPIGHG